VLHSPDFGELPDTSYLAGWQDRIFDFLDSNDRAAVN